MLDIFFGICTTPPSKIKWSTPYLELQIIFPCRDIGPATATLDPRPRHWTRDRDFGPATRDPRLLVKLG